MSKGITGGQAFPVFDIQSAMPKTLDSARDMSRGMSLRDYFAAKALQGLLAQSMGTAIGSDKNLAAVYAYEIADAMLKAREQ